MTDLTSFNAMIRKWADEQPVRYRLTALAFGYRCDRKTHSFDGTLRWISKKSRERAGEGVSRSKLADDLKAFEANGVISVERRRDGSRNKSSIYHVDFDKVIETDMGRRQRRRNRETAGQEHFVRSHKMVEDPAWLASLDVEPPEDIEPPKHEGWDLDACAACQLLPGDVGEKLSIHIAKGGLDPWQHAPL